MLSRPPSFLLGRLLSLPSHHRQSASAFLRERDTASEHPHRCRRARAILQLTSTPRAQRRTEFYSSCFARKHPFLALFGRARRTGECPLLGGERATGV